MLGLSQLVYSREIPYFQPFLSQRKAWRRMADRAEHYIFRWHRSTVVIRRSWNHGWHSALSRTRPVLPSPQRGVNFFLLDCAFRAGGFWPKSRRKTTTRTIACYFPHFAISLLQIGFLLRGRSPPAPRRWRGAGAASDRGCKHQLLSYCQKMAGQCASVNNAVMKWQRQAELSMLGSCL